MLTCGACLRRAFDALSGHSLPNNLNTGRHSLPPFRTIARPSRPSRRYATVSAHTSSAEATGPTLARGPTDRRGRKGPGLGRSAEWAARKELEYLGDPLHIANRVKVALEKDDFELASLITRQASKNTNVTVSWNHLIDYQLRTERIHSAIKLYNEMKKRAQHPNAQTFTIIFRGCAASRHSKLAVGEAVKLYQNMLTVGRIKPNTIHLNAVLQVCAKAGDLETMFGILTSSDDPLRSPNNLTYTTILNAMRRKAEEALGNKNPSHILMDREIQRERQTLIARAKTIWDEVISRWKSGSLIIDEELVCAMGRILLMGGYMDADAVEGLIEQTMMISRADNKGVSGQEGTKSAPLAVPRSVTKAPGAPAVNHALPGNNSLSMVLEALEKTRRTTKAAKYWNLFTLNYDVVPDADNWKRALGVFYRGKASGRAATALQEMPAHMISWKHIHLAMKTCLRDYLNRSALDNATAVLNMIGKTPSILHVRSLQTYLQLARAGKPSSDPKGEPDNTAATTAWAKNLATALENLFGPCQTLVKKHPLEPPNTDDPKELDQARNSRAEVVALARKMCAAYDILTDEYRTILTQDQIAFMKPKHVNLCRYVTAHFETEAQSSRKQVPQLRNADDDFGEHREYSKNANFERNVGSRRDVAFAQDYTKRKEPRPRRRGADNESFEDKFLDAVF
ncbi:putative pentatricopeptide repeat protein [Rosellinia necatrix]|uniref:Putative pentatricopeptide repeat protein n=1 Tax=Rosellinia necatrix TaxID=77044 RepID=A0A1W2TLM9_ROSNE|nr:putative pentatricopeptide repeat protein [Rosellinia necatrix]